MTQSLSGKHPQWGNTHMYDTPGEPQCRVLRSAVVIQSAFYYLQLHTTFLPIATFAITHNPAHESIKSINNDGFKGKQRALLLFLLLLLLLAV